MKLKEMFETGKTYEVKIDGVLAFRGNKYLELLRALGSIYMDEFIEEITNCDIVVNSGKFVWNNNKHTVECVER